MSTRVRLVPFPVDVVGRDALHGVDHELDQPAVVDARLVPGVVILDDVPEMINKNSLGGCLWA